MLTLEFHNTLERECYTLECTALEYIEFHNTLECKRVLYTRQMCNDRYTRGYIIALEYIEVHNTLERGLYARVYGTRLHSSVLLHICRVYSTRLHSSVLWGGYDE